MGCTNMSQQEFDEEIDKSQKEFEKMENHYTEFEKYLEARTNQKIFIKSDKIYTDLDMCYLREIFKKFSSTEIAKCIETPSEKFQNFIYKDLCSSGYRICKNAVVKKLSKTAFIKTIKECSKNGGFPEIYCEDCEIKNKVKQQELLEQQKKEYELRNKQEYEENTNIYINNYLNPNNSWNERLKPYQRYNEIRNNYSVYWKEICLYIKNMEYKEFLKTPYWKAISWKAKQKANFCCQLCNNSQGLETHHRTYESHGMEHANLEDLIVLCHDCHAKFHDKIP